MSRYAIAAIAAAVTFPIVWFVVRLFTILISNAIAKSREDFPPATEAGPWPVLIAALSATAVAYIIMRRR